MLSMKTCNHYSHRLLYTEVHLQTSVYRGLHMLPPVIIMYKMKLKCIFQSQNSKIGNGFKNVFTLKIASNMQFNYTKFNKTHVKIIATNLSENILKGHG